MNVIALDISKTTADCHLKRTNGITHTLKIENTLSGCLKLHKWIKSHRIRKLIIAMEATGVYYQTAADYFAKHYPVAVINPLKISAYAESQLSRTKTDKADAKLIAEYTSRHTDNLHFYHQPTDRQKQLAQLTALSAQINLQISQQKNRISIAEDPFINTIQNSILNHLKEQQNHVQQQIAALINQTETLKTHYQNLLTVPGIGEKTAPIILHYLSSKPFNNRNQFTAFAGLSPKIQQSGETVNKKGKMAKLGHRRLKAAFFLPALNAYRLGHFQQLIRNLTAAGKPKMVIIGALMRKLAKICFSIYKTGQPFDKSRHQPIAA